MEYALEINGLKKKYQDFELSLTDIKLPKGAILGIVGDNGAGKTTLLNLILNLVKKDLGEIRLFGDENYLSDKQSKKSISAILDKNYLSNSFTAEHVHKIMKLIYQESWDDDLFDKYCKKFEVPYGKQIKDFSKGMVAKINIAVALSHKSNLLFMDEATDGLDPLSRIQLLECLKAYVEDGEKNLILSSHIISDIEKIADYILVISDGKQVVFEKTDELMQKFCIARAQDQGVIEEKYCCGRYHDQIIVRTSDEITKVYPEVRLKPCDLEETILFLIEKGKSERYTSSV